MFLEPVNLMVPGTMLGIVGYFLVTRSETRKWFKAGIGMLVTTGLLVILAAAADRVYFIEQDLSHTEKWHLGFGHSISFANGKEGKFDSGKDVTVNNSDKTFTIKSVTYLSHSWLEDPETQVELVVPPYSTYYFKEPISWWFREPPDTIKVKSTSEDVIRKYYIVAD